MVFDEARRHSVVLMDDFLEGSTGGMRDVIKKNYDSNGLDFNTRSEILLTYFRFTPVG